MIPLTCARISTGRKASVWPMNSGSSSIVCAVTVTTSTCGIGGASFVGALPEQPASDVRHIPALMPISKIPICRIDLVKLNFWLIMPFRSQKIFRKHVSTTQHACLSIHAIYRSIQFCRKFLLPVPIFPSASNNPSFIWINTSG